RPGLDTIDHEAAVGRAGDSHVIGLHDLQTAVRREHVLGKGGGGTAVGVNHHRRSSIHGSCGRGRGRGSNRPAGRDRSVVKIGVPGTADRRGKPGWVAGAEVPQRKHVTLLDVREQEDHPGTAPAAAEAEAVVVRGATWWELAVVVLIGGQSHADLVKVVTALRATSRVADFLDR